MSHLASSPRTKEISVIRPQEALEEQICAVHKPDYLRRLEAFGTGMLDPDTWMTSGSLTAAKFAVGAAVCAVDQVMAGRPLAFSLARPPGHHALPDRSMGFCILNNAAVAAAHALSSGSKKVLVVDWDVHHGNGTQHIFYDTPNVLYFSVHQSRHFPFTGRAVETGEGNGRGYTVNVPLPPGSGDSDYIEAFRRLLVPIADEYRPDLVIVSAGFDPAKGDMLGDMVMTPAGFRQLAFLVRSMGNIKGTVALLEGGYSGLLPKCVEASIQGFLGESDEIDTIIPGPTKFHIQEAVRIQQHYWRL